MSIREKHKNLNQNSMKPWVFTMKRYANNGIWWICEVDNKIRPITNIPFVPWYGLLACKKKLHQTWTKRAFGGDSLTSLTKPPMFVACKKNINPKRVGSSSKTHQDTQQPAASPPSKNHSRPIPTTSWRQSVVWGPPRVAAKKKSWLVIAAPPTYPPKK